MRVLIDLTNSPHVPFFAPLIRALEEDGHQVVVVARRFAQTVELVELHGLRDVTVIGAHGGTGRVGKARAALGRTWALWSFARRQRAEHGAFDVAFSHGSTDLPLVSRILGVPHITIFDYEWARTMHRLNCRVSWRVVVPESIPLERLDAYGAAGKTVTYPGLKEEYYLDAAALDPAAVRTELGIDPDAVLVVLRPPADMALYHRGIDNDVFGAVLSRVRAREGCVAVVLARTDAQRAELERTTRDDPSVIMPTHAVDGASLVAAADVVVSAGGTMNREAAALGVPVYTVFAGRMGGVDETLLQQGRLARLERAEDVALERRNSATAAPRLTTDRDPRELLATLLDGLPITPSAQSNV